MHTAGRQGRLAKSVTVYSNDPQQPRFVLKVEGTVELLAGFEPAFLSLRDIAAGTKVTREVKLVGKRVAELRLRNIRSNRPQELAARLSRGAGGPVIAVTFRAGKKIGSFNGAITAETGLDQPRSLELRVWANVTGDLQAEPRFVVFAPFDEKRREQQTFRVRSVAGRPFAIRAVQDPTAVVQGKAVRQGKEWQIVLHLAKAGERTMGTIQLQTDRKDQPSLLVRYSISRLRPGTAAVRATQLLRRPSMLRALIPPKPDGAPPKR